MSPHLLRHPLLVPLVAGLLLRALAAQFSTGYLMHDDHFLVVEAAGSWTAGKDYNRWLPWNQRGTPEAHPANFAYVGSQFVVLSALQAMGIDHPETQVACLRWIHALYSLLTIALGYRLVRRLAPERPKVAVTAAWVLAAGGLWPLLSVHQLVEMVCIPPVMWALARLAKSGPLRAIDWLVIGAGIGIATGIRFQCGLLGVALVPVLLWQKQWRALLGIGTIALATFSLMQSPDWFIWGEPFVQLRAYISYNSTHAGNYPTGPWYQYILTLLGLLVPPVSVMLLWGVFVKEPRTKEAWWRVAAPVLLFFVFHSLVINKQERFILPVVPALIALGTVGWDVWIQRSLWWKRREGLQRGLWLAFWGISAVVLVFSIPYEAKRARVQAMSFLYEQGTEDFALIEVDSGAMPPRFYSGAWGVLHIDNRRDGAGRPPREVAKTWCAHPPEYILFQGDAHLAEAIQDYKTDLPGLRYVTTIQSGRIDQWLSRLNPINSSERIMIYAVDDALPCP